MYPILGITTCVNYAQYLREGLSRWKEGCDPLIVLTSPKDEETQKLCASTCTTCHITDKFYEGGALFNKGAALNWEYTLIKAREYAGWVLCRCDSA
jgi:hypothetical protein